MGGGRGVMMTEYKFKFHQYLLKGCHVIDTKNSEGTKNSL